MELNHLRFIHGSGLMLLALLWLVSRSHWGMTVVGMVLVPAVLAGYAMEKPLLRLLNPVDWIRTYVGFGPCLLTLAVMTALLIAVVHGTADPDRPRFFRYWLLLNAPAAWLIVLGRCVFERRLEMNFEPIHAPERAADRQRITERAQMGRFLDALYVAVRNNDRPRIDVLMTDHLTALDAAARAHDAELIMQRLHVWGDGAGSAYVRSLLAKQFAPTEEQQSDGLE